MIPSILKIIVLHAPHQFALFPRGCRLSLLLHCLFGLSHHHLRLGCSASQWQVNAQGNGQANFNQLKMSGQTDKQHICVLFFNKGQDRICTILLDIVPIFCSLEWFCLFESLLKISMAHLWCVSS